MKGNGTYDLHRDPQLLEFLRVVLAALGAVIGDEDELFAFAHINQPQPRSRLPLQSQEEHTFVTQHLNRLRYPRQQVIARPEDAYPSLPSAFILTYPPRQLHFASPSPDSHPALLDPISMAYVHDS